MIGRGFDPVVGSNWQAAGGLHGDDWCERRRPQFGLRMSLKRPLAVDGCEKAADKGEGPIDGLQKRIECDQDGENDHHDGQAAYSHLQE